MYQKEHFNNAIGSRAAVDQRMVYADWLDENGFATEARWQRLGGAVGRNEFEQCVIAQDDDNDYSESGYVACVVPRAGETFALLAHYGHCSCYGTWDAICEGGTSDYFEDDVVMYPAWTWIGSVEELVHAARTDLDLTTRGRKLDDEDHDVDHLREVYRQVRGWADKKGK